MEREFTIKVIKAEDLPETLNNLDKPGLVVVYKRICPNPNDPKNFRVFEDLSDVGKTKHQD